MARQPTTLTAAARKRPSSRARKSAPDAAPEAAAKPAETEAKPAPTPKTRRIAKTAAAPKEEPKRLTLPGVGAASTRLRTVLLNFAFVGAFIVLVPVIVSQFWRNEVLIDRIPVPAELSDLGLTADVAASRLWDGLRDATGMAGTTKESLTAIPDAKRVQFTLPESGFSMESLIQQTRQFFNAYQTRIGGEFTCADPSCDPAGIRLRLRILTDKTHVVDLPAIGTTPLREYFTQAGLQVLSVLDPFVAIAAIQQTQPTRALVLARNLVRQNHPDAKWALNLIGSLHSADDPASAIASYEAALEIDPRFIAARSNLATALVDAKRFDEAQAQYDILMREAPTHRNVVQGMAQFALAEQRYDDAEADLKRGAVLFPKDPYFVSFLGNVAEARGDAEAAVPFYEKALQMDPAFGPALEHLGYYHLTAGDFAAARPVYEDFLAYEPDNVTAGVLYAAVLIGQGELDAAIATLDRFEPKAPNDVVLLVQKASALTLLDRPVEAVSYLRRAIALDDTNALAFAQLGRLEMMTGAKGRCIESYDHAITLAPDNLDVLDGAALCHAASGDYPEAIRITETVVAKDGTRVLSLFSLANYLKFSGQNDRAVAAYRNFLAVVPDFPFYADSRALAESAVAELTATAAATPP